MKIKNQDINDEELLAAYRESKEPDYMVLLYGRYMPMVYGVALKYFKDSDDARNAVIRIFEELLIKTLQDEIQCFKNWLYTCVRDYCLMQLRNRSKDISITLDEDFMEFCDDYDLDMIREEEAKEKIVLKCVEALPEKQRICVHRFFMEDRSYKEIEEATGFSLKLVKNFIQNGKRNLKLCLERKGISS